MRKSNVLLRFLVTLGMIISLMTASEGFISRNIKSSVHISKDSTELDEKFFAKIGVSKVVENIKYVIPGKITGIELENEDGNLFYRAEVLKDGGEVVNVLIDAGNGDILTKEIDSQDKEEWYKLW